MFATSTSRRTGPSTSPRTDRTTRTEAPTTRKTRRRRRALASRRSVAVTSPSTPTSFEGGSCAHSRRRQTRRFRTSTSPPPSCVLRLSYEVGADRGCDRRASSRTPNPTCDDSTLSSKVSASRTRSSGSCSSTRVVRLRSQASGSSRMRTRTTRRKVGSLSSDARAT